MIRRNLALIARPVWMLVMSIFIGMALNSQVRGDIFVASRFGGVGEYSMSGVPVNPSLISGGSGSIGGSGSNLYVGNFNTGGNGFVNEYTTSGVPVATPLISGTFFAPTAVAISGSDLYVATSTTIGKYNAITGATINASLVAGLNQPNGIAVSGSNLFVTNWGTSGGYIGEYDTVTGATINTHLVTGLIQPTGIVASGSALFFTNGNTVGKYDTLTDTLNPSFITGFINSFGITLSGSSLYVASWGFPAATGGSIGEYTTSGVPVNPSLVTGLSNPWDVVVAPVPEPTTLVVLALGAAAFCIRRR